MRKPKRPISLFNFLVLIFTLSAIIILFVYNIIQVNRLSMENNALREEYSKTVVINNSLSTEIERMTTYDKIKTVAVDKLKMAYPEKNKTIIINNPENENIK